MAPIRPPAHVVANAGGGWLGVRVAKAAREGGAHMSSSSIARKARAIHEGGTQMSRVSAGYRRVCNLHSFPVLIKLVTWLWLLWVIAYMILTACEPYLQP